MGSFYTPRFARLTAILATLLIAGSALAQTPAAAPAQPPAETSAKPDANVLVEAAFDHMRGKTSISTVRMTIHRPTWERVMTIKGSTRGQDVSVFHILAPPKDRGNGTLKDGRHMWTYNPKVNRVIKIPPSMMSQSWMGSDFSNNDLAKSDSLLIDYDHTLEGTETHDGKTVYLIKSMPRPMAPVVWGMITLKLREDDIMLEEIFYDEDLLPVKELQTLDIQMMSGRLFPKRWRMRKAGQDAEYTLVEYDEIQFDASLPDSLFTLQALRTPAR